MKAVVGWMLIGLSVSCSRTREPSRALLSIEVRDPYGSPVADATVSVNGETAGKSDGKGGIDTWIQGAEGRRFDIAVQCPEGYREERRSRGVVSLRVMRSVADRSAGPVPLRASLYCVPSEQLFVLVVKTDPGQEIPITAQGKAVDRTDRDGAAQIVLGGAVGEEIEVVLDTSAHPELLPRSPSRRVRVPDTPRILVFEQSFKIQKKRPPRKMKGRRGPQRI